MVIVLGYCAGHGGFRDRARKIYATPGKRTPDGEPEWDFNNTVAVAFAKELSKYSDIKLIRFDDPTGITDVTLKNRTDKALSEDVDYYISFHHNANTSNWGNWTGVETFTHTSPNSKSKALAQAVHPALVKAYGLRDRGIKTGNLHITREMQRKYNSKTRRYDATNIGVILVEGGFMDSVIDIKKMRDKKVLENVGIEIAKAVAKHLNLKLKEPVKIITKEEILNMLNVTGRDEAKKMIKRGVAEGLFTSKHENIDKYTDEELISYSLAYVNRKLERIGK